jgi:hypothetical protein
MIAYLIHNAPTVAALQKLPIWQYLEDCGPVWSMQPRNGSMFVFFKDDPIDPNAEDIQSAKISEGVFYSRKQLPHLSDLVKSTSGTVHTVQIGKNQIYLQPATFLPKDVVLGCGTMRFVDSQITKFGQAVYKYVTTPKDQLTLELKNDVVFFALQHIYMLTPELTMRYRILNQTNIEDLIKIAIGEDLPKEPAAIS